MSAQATSPDVFDETYRTDVELPSSARIRPVELQWPCLNLLGMGAWWAWIWLCYNSTQLFCILPPADQAASVRLMYLASTAGIALMCMAGGLAWRRATRLVANNALVVGAGLLAGVASALVAPSMLVLGGWAGAACSLLTGVFTSVLCLKSGHLYGQMGLGYTLTAGCISLVFAALLYFAGMSLGGYAAILYVSCLPLCGALLMILREEDPLDVSLVSQSASAAESGTCSVFWRMIAASCMIALVAGASRGISTSVMLPEQYGRTGMHIVGACGAAGLAITVWINVRGAKKALKGSYALLMLVAVVVSLLSNFGTIVAYLSVTKEPLWMIFSCLLAYMAFRYEFSPVRAFGLAQSAYFLSSLVGWGVGGVLGDLTTDALKLSVSIVLCIVLFVTFVFVFRPADVDYIVDHKRGRGHDRAATVGAVREGALRDASPAPLDVQAEGAAAGRSADGRAGGAGAHPYSDDVLTVTFALSQREIEIARLFASGRSANWIADELTISKNTVRSHLRSVYVKLDVHTRQELIDSLG